METWRLDTMAGYLPLSGAAGPAQDVLHQPPAIAWISHLSTVTK